MVQHLPDPAQPTSGIPWWVLTVLFGVGEVFVLHIQVRREAQTVSLSEIPLVLGLFFSTPPDFVVGWLVGPLLVFVLHRRQPLIKVGYNLALLAAEACFSLAVFHLLAPDPVHARADGLARGVRRGHRGRLAVHHDHHRRHRAVRGRRRPARAAHRAGHRRRLVASR